MGTPGFGGADLLRTFFSLPNLSPDSSGHLSPKFLPPSPISSIALLPMGPFLYLGPSAPPQFCNPAPSLTPNHHSEFPVPQTYMPPASYLPFASGARLGQGESWGPAGSQSLGEGEEMVQPEKRKGKRSLAARWAEEEGK